MCLGEGERKRNCGVQEKKKGCSGNARSVEVLGEPLETGRIAGAAEDAAHEDLDGAREALDGGAGLLAGGGQEAEAASELGLRERALHVDLVAEDEERHLRELLARKQAVELALRLADALRVVRVDNVHDRVAAHAVLLPQAPHRRVTPKVKRAELDVAHDKLFLGCLCVSVCVRVQ